MGGIKCEALLTHAVLNIWALVMLVVALDAMEVCSVFFWFYCLGALPHQTKHVAQPCMGLADVTH